MDDRDKKLRIKAPVTTDGITLKYDGKNQPIYKEIPDVPLEARRNINLINEGYEAAGKPHLKWIIEEMDSTRPKFGTRMKEIKEARDKAKAELTKEILDQLREAGVVIPKTAGKKQAKAEVDDDI